MYKSRPLQYCIEVEVERVLVGPGNDEEYQRKEEETSFFIIIEL